MKIVFIRSDTNDCSILSALSSDYGLLSAPKLSIKFKLYLSSILIVKCSGISLKDIAINQFLHLIR